MDKMSSELAIASRMNPANVVLTDLIFEKTPTDRRLLFQTANHNTHEHLDSMHNTKRLCFSIVVNSIQCGLGLDSAVLNCMS